MNITVIGGGSIGLLISSYLSERHQVSLYVRRDEQKQMINDNQIYRTNNGVQVQSTNIVANTVENIHSRTDLCIICVKQTQINDVLKEILMIDDNIPLLFLQNGMGHIDMLADIPNPIYVGVINHGSHRTSDNTVHHLGNGSIDVASFSGNKEQLHTLINSLHESNFPIIHQESWEIILKEKLIVNAVINPLTALFDVKNGKIITNKYIYNLAKNICEETALVLYLPTDSSWKKVMEIAKQTKENVSSMRADIQGKRETEIEAITGYILKTAQISLPYTTFIYEAIRALELERT